MQEYGTRASSSNSPPSGSRVVPVRSPRSVESGDPQSAGLTHSGRRGPAAAGVSELQNAGDASHPFGVGSERDSSPGRVIRDGGNTIIVSGSPKKSAASSQMAELTMGSTQPVTSQQVPCSPTNAIIERDDERKGDSMPGGQKDLPTSTASSDEATATPSYKCLPSCLASMLCCSSNAKVHHDKIDNFQVSAETKTAELEGPSAAQLEVRSSNILYFDQLISKRKFIVSMIQTF